MTPEQLLALKQKLDAASVQSTLRSQMFGNRLQAYALTNVSAYNPEMMQKLRDDLHSELDICLDACDEFARLAREMLTLAAKAKR